MIVPIATGLLIELLLIGFILLYVNFPLGYSAPYGLNLEAPTLFRGLWRYPIVPIQPHTFGILAGLSILLLWFTYLGTSFASRNVPGIIVGAPSALLIAGFSVLYNVTLLLFMPTVLSSDIFHYASFGRMVAFYHLNPYVTSDLAIRADPIWQLAFWKDITTLYGPVWTLISAGAALLGGKSVILTVLAFKGVAALFNMANCLLVFLLARRFVDWKSAVVALQLYAWNPLILIETAGSGHNDAVMMTFALLGVLLVARRRVLLGLAVLVLSVLVKYLTALLVFFVVIAVLTSTRDRKAIISLAARMTGVGVTLLAVLYAPFWAGPRVFSELVAIDSAFHTPVRFELREGLAHLLANGGNLATARVAAEPYVAGGLHLAFICLVLYLAATLLFHGAAEGKEPDWPYVLERWGIASLVYVALVYGWNFPWYLIAPMATAFAGTLTRTNNRLQAACSGLGIIWMMYYAILIPT